MRTTNPHSSNPVAKSAFSALRGARSAFSRLRRLERSRDIPSRYRRLIRNVRIAAEIVVAVVTVLLTVLQAYSHVAAALGS